MATTNVITSLGASDIDTKELTTNLVAATKEPRQKIIDDERKKAEVAISSAALLKNGLAALQAAATEIGSATKLNQVQVTSTNSSVVSASSLGSAVAAAGTYSIKVDQLATSRRVSVNFAADYANPITLQLTVPGISTGTIDIEPGSTPSNIVGQVNTWLKTNAPNSGLTATLVNTGKGDKPLSLVLQGATGSTNGGFDIEAKDRNTNVTSSDFVVSRADGKNAQFTVNGIEMERRSNTITDVASGLSLELTAVSATPAVISAKPDPSTIVTNIRSFVDTYNTIADFLKKATGPKIAGDEVAGSLQYDASARGVLARLRSSIIAPFSDSTKSVSITHWSSLGVEFQRDGTLQFKSESRFTDAYAKNPSDVITALSNGAPSPYFASRSPSGLAGDVARASYDLISSSDSAIPAMSKSYQDKVDRLSVKQAALDAYIERLTANYEKQFTAMNSVLASFKNTQSQLTNTMNLNSKD
jgi:flagellar hook-associated protein 2